MRTTKMTDEQRQSQYEADRAQQERLAHVFAFLEYECRMNDAEAKQTVQELWNNGKKRAAMA